MALEFMDRSSLRSTHRRQINGGMQVAASASNLKISETRVQGVAQRWRRLCRATKAQHALRPVDAGQFIGLPVSVPRPLGGHAN